MVFRSFVSSAALQVSYFCDFDGFSPDEFLGNSRSIPLNFANVSLARAVVRLPACQILVQKTFARILDVECRIPGTLLFIPLDEQFRACLNGSALNGRSFVALRGNADGYFLEAAANSCAVIILSPTLSERGWFQERDRLLALSADIAALQKLRGLLARIVRIASRNSEVISTKEFALSLEEELLAALDGLFAASRRSGHAKVAGRQRYVQIVRRLDGYLDAYPTRAVYSSTLANECGTSVRTLVTAVKHVRGMSVHQYVRLRKLFEIRKTLQKGYSDLAVGLCAKSYGFQHFGAFSYLYRSTFGEPPSSTLARARQKEIAGQASLPPSGFGSGPENAIRTMVDRPLNDAATRGLARKRRAGAAVLPPG
jgi:AraC family ethanolamine operon transcriptional activator